MTIRHDLHALSKFFKYSLKQRWIRENPLLTVDIPSDREAIRTYVVSTQEERLYFEHAARFPLLFDLATLLLNQGMRPEEIMGLRRDDIDLGKKTLLVTKGKTRAARRTINLTSESLAILARRLADPKRSPWVFPSPRVPHAHIGRLNTSHDEICKETGLSFCLYDLRHTFATRMAAGGCDLATLAAILGHSSIRLVMRYVHPTAAHQKEAMRKYGETREITDTRIVQ